MERQIVALGGGGFSDREDAPLDDFVLGLAGTARPRVCFLPTASAPLVSANARAISETTSSPARMFPCAA